MRLILAAVALTLACSAGPRAGVARVDITPAGPIWLGGYAARTHPSVGVELPLYARALALEDGRGGRAVIVTAELLALPGVIVEPVAAEAYKRYGLERAALVFNGAHTHSGPVIEGHLSLTRPPDAANARIVAAYGETLKQKLVEVIGAALSDLKPATLSFGYGEAGFAMNRRQPTPKGVIIGANPEGPVDHRVPVLRVSLPGGKLRALLFGYACHNTTLTGDFYKLSGDYAGFAMSEIEHQTPGVVALFMQLCAGNQDPQPRGTLDLTRAHGHELAAAVMQVATGRMAPVSGPLRTAFLTTELPFAAHTRQQFVEEAKDPNKYKARRARNVLRLYDEGHNPLFARLPVQAIRFAHGFTLLALGGEPMVEYDLWARQSFPKEPLMMAGYSNHVPGYIPTAAMFTEGGYEPEESMIYYGMPGPFTPEVETRVKEAVRTVMERVRR